MVLFLSYRGWRFISADVETSIPLCSEVPTTCPLITVLIPARNEELEIGKTLEALSQQIYPNLEVIIIDDRSTDRTASIARSFAEEKFNISVITGQPLPKGWTGKNYALYQGAQKAKGEWLLFIDADTVLAPEAIVSAFEYAAQNRVDFLSLSNYIILKGFWENVLLLSMEFIFRWFANTLEEVNDPKNSVAAANAYFILCQRENYEKTGGHESIKSELFDSYAFPRIIKESGFNLKFLGDRNLISTRMYHGFKEIWDGFSKVAYPIVGRKLAIVFLYTLATILGAIIPFFLPVVLLITGDVSKLQIVLSVLPSLVIVSSMIYYILKVKHNPWYALALPLGAAVAILIGFNSVRQAMSKKGIHWRGRYYGNGYK